MSTPGPSQAADPGRRQVGESHKDHADRLYGMYRALLADVGRLREIEQAARDRVTYDPADQADQALVHALERRPR